VHKIYEKNSIAVVRCDRCSFVFATAPFDAELYGASYFNGQSIPFQDQAIGYSCDYFSIKKREKIQNAKRELKKIHTKTKAPGRLLDIGCASGFFLDEARRQGWETVGLEISEYASSYARDHLGLDVHTGTLETSTFPPESFDVVTAWDVIEHVPNPVEFFTTISVLLKPGGWFACGTPNFDSWARKIRQQNWHHLRPPEHLSYFSPQTLERVLLQFFDRVEVRPSRAPVTCVSGRKQVRKLLYTIFDIAATPFNQNEYQRAYARKAL
jgi:2-polyprenyl-3-methyl-5-hydroxy-6-metoxy-1,4-benzoquinol methylase